MKDTEFRLLRSLIGLGGKARLPDIVGGSGCRDDEVFMSLSVLRRCECIDRWAPNTYHATERGLIAHAIETGMRVRRLSATGILAAGT